MDEDLSIINANTRNEKIRNFFLNNKNKIIFGIIILVIIVTAVYGFDKYLTNKKKEISQIEKIAKKFPGVSKENIHALNPNKSIKPGQLLKIKKK